MDVLSLSVLFLVAGNAQISEVSHDILTYKCAVLADACCESDHINAVHSCRVGADVLGYSVAESIDCELGVLVAALVSVLEIAEVRGKSVRQSKNAGLLVEL